MKKIESKGRTKITGNYIKKHLTDMGQTQAWLARKCGVLPAHISEITLNKRKGISLAIAAKIARALKQPLEKVFIY
jgi:transcriptional regulator with XRE-family HTH domain